MAFVYFIGAHALLFYILFSSFYKRAYKHNDKVSCFCDKAWISWMIFKYYFQKDDDTVQTIAQQHITESTPIYQTMGKVEASYTTTKHRVFIGSQN